MGALRGKIDGVMRKVSILFFLTIVTSALAHAGVKPSSDVKIRVRVVEAAPKVMVRGFDLKIYQGLTDRKLASSPDRVSEWELRCGKGRVRAEARKPERGIHPIELKAPLTFEAQAGFLNLQGRPYRELIHVYSVGNDCEVVNEVSLEKYLDGLVNAEFSAKWKEEAIAAQVVAARTYAYYQIQGSRRRHFDVDATIKDQVYDGSMKEDYRASLSVKRTEGLLLTTGGTMNPLPIKAFYHSTCGGQTELPENVWGGKYPGFKRSVHCPYCANSPRFNWDTEFTAREFSDVLLRTAKSGLNRVRLRSWPADWKKWVATPENLRDIRVGARDAQGRVSRLIASWVHDGATTRLELTAQQLRDWFGAVRVRSATFEIFPQGGTRWRLEGRGYGHGVGLCQWGAKVMGEKGYSMASILKFYYPDATVRKLW